MQQKSNQTFAGSFHQMPWACRWCWRWSSCYCSNSSTGFHRAQLQRQGWCEDAGKIIDEVRTSIREQQWWWCLDRIGWETGNLIHLKILKYFIIYRSWSIRAWLPRMSWTSKSPHRLNSIIPAQWQVWTFKKDIKEWRIMDDDDFWHR